MDQFILIEQDDDHLYIKILSSRYIAPYYGLNKDDHRYTFTIGDKRFFGCLTTNCQQSTESTIYPYIITITFQYYMYKNNHTPITNTENQRQYIEQVVQQKVQDAIEQQIDFDDFEQLRQFKQLHEKVELLQQRVIDVTRKVKRYIRL